MGSGGNLRARLNRPALERSFCEAHSQAVKQAEREGEKRSGGRVRGKAREEREERGEKKGGMRGIGRRGEREKRTFFCE